MVLVVKSSRFILRLLLLSFAPPYLLLPLSFCHSSNFLFCKNKNKNKNKNKSMQHAACSMQHAACSIQHPALSSQQPRTNKQEPTLKIHHAPCTIDHAVYTIEKQPEEEKSTSKSKKEGVKALKVSFLSFRLTSSSSSWPSLLVPVRLHHFDYYFSPALSPSTEKAFRCNLLLMEPLIAATWNAGELRHPEGTFPFLFLLLGLSLLLFSFSPFSFLLLFSFPSPFPSLSRLSLSPSLFILLVFLFSTHQKHGRRLGPLDFPFRFTYFEVTSRSSPGEMLGDREEREGRKKEHKSHTSGKSPKTSEERASDEQLNKKTK